MACHRGDSLVPVLWPGAGSTSSISDGFGGQGKGEDGAEPRRAVRWDERERDQKGCEAVCAGPRGQAGVAPQRQMARGEQGLNAGVFCVLTAAFCALSHVEGSEWRDSMKSGVF